MTGTEEEPYGKREQDVQRPCGGRELGMLTREREGKLWSKQGGRECPRVGLDYRTQVHVKDIAL